MHHAHPFNYPGNKRLLNCCYCLYLNYSQDDTYYKTYSVSNLKRNQICHDLPYAMCNYYHACAKRYFRKLNLTVHTSVVMTHIPRNKAVTGFTELVSRTRDTRGTQFGR